MDRVDLFSDELCFAILLESHLVVCQCLFDFVLDAVKASNPQHWMEVLCAGNRDSLSKFLQVRLQNNLPQSDMYCVCKLLRLRLNDVARYCSEELADPRRKERICLQVHGVETARHWVFHGDQQVSPKEVRSCVLLLRTILKTLSCKCKSMAGVAEKLSELVEKAQQLENTEIESKRCSVQTNIVASAFVNKSLAEMKRNFEEMFRQRQSAPAEERRSPDRNASSEERLADDFSSLFKKLKKALSERPKNKAGSQYIAMCENIRKERNRLAHSPPLTIAVAKKVLCEIESLLHTFDLSCKQTKSALGRIARLETTAAENEVLCCIVQRETDDSCQTLNDSERIFRPSGKLLIGREEEIEFVRSELTKAVMSTWPVVLISGPAGVGKSYLATHIANSFVHVCNRQAWISCSCDHELRQDLSSAFSIDGADFSKEDSSDLLKFIELMKIGSRLVVFDDVCSSTMHLISDLITDNNRAIVTTRSTAVKLFLQQTHGPLHVVELKAFSSEESWALVEKMVKVSGMDTETLASIDKVLNEVLENLPLCVSIYSSWLTVYAKRKDKRTAGDGDTKDGDLCVANTTMNWGDVEAGFGDRYHIRGLTGMIQSAECCLEEHPLVVLLLVKICMVDSKRIPWEVIRKSYRWTAYEVCPRLKNLVCSVLGVTDWLFSDSGQETLEKGRDALEELGLIRREAYSDRIIVHGLTLQGMQQMLASRALFLDSLVAECVQKGAEHEASKIEAESIGRCLSEELLLQVLCRGIVVIRQAAAGELEEEQIEEVKQFTFSFLSNLVDKTLPQRLSRMIWSTEQLRRARSFLVESLYCSMDMLGIAIRHKDELLCWEKAYLDCPRSERILELLQCTRYCTEGSQLLSKHCYASAIQNFQQMLALGERLFGFNSYFSLFAHSKIAECLEQSKGPSARAGIHGQRCTPLPTIED